MRQPKGSVTVESVQGWLRLRLPRHVFNGEQKRIALSLSDTKENRKVAEARAKEIESDIVFGRFDQTLIKYKPYAPDAIPGLPLLNELWSKYTEFKARSLAHATITKDFKKTANHISALPTQDLNHAKIIKRHLVNSLSPDAARRCLIQIRACCEWAEEQELIPLNPFMKLPKLQSVKSKGINPFTEAEMQTIITAFEINRYYRYYAPFVKFLFLTGCRTSEAIALTWRQISTDLNTITFSPHSALQLVTFEITQS
ncbi:Arm DNA-binding domain-containing protein [Crinalium epipsammum]|uniref:Arm DNA-binding domain-containing protein n=1 Tax=Crinalium epipsammum TaxID=241425 RepID=UPI000301DF5D|nr:DUF3596 domain-containing protein [Crinalium epipsammum]